jgi:hypothetical protein
LNNISEYFGIEAKPEYKKCMDVWISNVSNKQKEFIEAALKLKAYEECV